jgi:hypothetical protein
VSCVDFFNETLLKLIRILIKRYFESAWIFIWGRCEKHYMNERKALHSRTRLIDYGVWQYPSILRQLIEDRSQIIVVYVLLNMIQRREIGINQKILCRLSKWHQYIVNVHFRMFFVRCERLWYCQQRVFGRTEPNNLQHQFKVNIDVLDWIYDSDEETKKSKLEML